MRISDWSSDVCSSDLMINQIETDSIKHPDTNSLEFRKKLVSELATLYPQGPEQDDIWKRDGGDVSILTNSGSRKSQWFNVIEKLNLGGGGKSISITSLMNEVKKDYPNFNEIGRASCRERVCLYL